MRSKLLLVLVVCAQLVSVTWARTTQTNQTAPTSKPDEGSFTGIVRESFANNPLPGVRISVVNIATNAQQEATTSATGQFAVTGLPRGIYRIVAERQDFQTVIRVEPMDESPPSVNFWLPTLPAREGTGAALGVLTGTVRNFDNVSLPGVRLTISEKAAGKSQQIVSDPRGSYSVSNLNSGTYEIMAEHEGYQPLRLGDIRLVGTFTAQLHIKLQPTTGRPAPAPTTTR